MQQHSGRGVHPLLQPLYAGLSSTSPPKGVHPLLRPLYAGNSSSTSPPILILSVQDCDMQTEVPALRDATNLHTRPVTEATPKSVMIEENLDNFSPMEPFMVDRSVSVSIYGMSSSRGRVMAVTYATVTCVSYSRTMHGLFAVAVVTGFAFKQDELLKKAQADKPVNQVQLGEPPPWTGV